MLGVRRGVWLLLAYGLLNLVVLLVLRPAPNADWATAWWPLAQSGSDPYELPWRYSPLLLPLIPLLVAGGPWLLGVAHLAAVATLIRLGPWTFWLVALSAFFWTDMLVGNVFTFVAVAGAFALAGSRSGALLYLALTLLMPRPVQLPLAMWLIWRQADLRRPFAVLCVISVVGVTMSGHALEWMRMLFQSGSKVGEPYAIGPDLLVGQLWLAIGIPVAAVMVWRGSARVAAMAGLVAAPYLLPQYLLLAVAAISGPVAARNAKDFTPSPGTSWYPGTQGAVDAEMNRIARFVGRRRAA